MTAEESPRHATPVNVFERLSNSLRFQWCVLVFGAFECLVSVASLANGRRGFRVVTAPAFFGVVAIAAGIRLWRIYRKRR